MHNSISFSIVYQSVTEELITDIIICRPQNITTYTNDINLKHIPHFRGKALWDTGATNTCITDKVANHLELLLTGIVPTINAGGMKDSYLYHISIVLPNGIGLPFLSVTEQILPDFDVLVGMDIITKGDFAITNKNGQTLFSYRIPSSGFIDFTGKISQ